MTSGRKTITAVVLWLVFALAVWNVIFDRILVLAGRGYVHDATLTFRTSHQYLRIDDVMRPAAGHAVRVASVSAGAIVVVAMVAIFVAADRDARRRRRESSSG